MPSCCYTSETVWYASGIVENLYGCDGVAHNMNWVIMIIACVALVMFPVCKTM
jgi:hypothetical protein